MDFNTVHVDGAYATKVQFGDAVYARCKTSKNPLYFTAVFNLRAFIVYSFCSLSFMYFLYRQKVPKSPAQSKNSRNVLRNVDNTALSHPVRCKLRLHCARLYAGGIVDLQANSCHTVSTQPNIACRLSLFVSVQALRDLCGLALLKKYNATAL